MFKSNSFQTSLRLPGPKSLPLLGWKSRLLQFAYHPVFFMEKMHNEFGKIASIANSCQNFIFVFEPSYSQQILKAPKLYHSHNLKTSPLPFPDNSNLMKMDLGLSLVNGSQHKRLRKLMLPFFQKNRLISYHQDIVTLSEKMLSKWTPGQTINLLKEMREISLWLSVKALFGLEQDEKGVIFTKMVEDLMSKFYSLPVWILPINIPGLPFWSLIKQGDQLSTEIQAVIESKRDHRADKVDVLSHLIWLNEKDQSKLSDEELIGQVINMFRGSYPSTAASLTWTLFLLLQHPSVLVDLLAELNKVLGGATPSFEQLDQMTFLDAVINESMRLLPPTPYVIRYNTEPVQLGSFTFIEKTNFVLSIFNIHRLTELYNNPYRFLPKRWLTIKPSSYEYLPFIAGPRMCIGATFAKILMKIVLVGMLQKYSFSLPSHKRVDAIGMRGLVPANGLPVLVHGFGKVSDRVKVAGNINRLVHY